MSTPNYNFQRGNDPAGDRFARNRAEINAGLRKVVQLTLATHVKAAAIDVTALERQAHRPTTFTDLFWALLGC